MMYSKEYNTFLGSECLLACFQNIINYRNLNISESDIFLLGNGLKTIYRHDTAKDKFNIHLFSNVHGSIFKFCKDYKVKTNMKEILNNNDAKDVMINYLSNNNPVTVKIDPSYLNYSPVYTSGQGLTHYINIVQYCEKDDSVLISDGFIPTIPPSVYHSWYDYKFIERGRSLKNNFYIVFDVRELNDNKLLQDSIKTHKYIKLKENLTEYLNSYVDGEYIYGIKALQQFGEDIPGFLELFGDKFSDTMFKLYYNMKIHGLIISKHLLLEAFRELIKFYNYSIKYVYETEEIVKEWEKISLLIAKAGVLKSKEYLITVSNRIKNVVLKEENVYNKILLIL